MKRLEKCKKHPDIEAYFNEGLDESKIEKNKNKRQMRKELYLKKGSIENDARGCGRKVTWMSEDGKWDGGGVPVITSRNVQLGQGSIWIGWNGNQGDRRNDSENGGWGIKRPVPDRKPPGMMPTKERRYLPKSLHVV